MYTNEQILQITKTQLALDYNCQLSDFEKDKNTIVKNGLLEGRRIYISDGCFFKILCFGNKAIICTESSMIPWCEENLLNSNTAWLFEYPKLRTIDKKLQEYGHEIEDIHYYYLPRPNISEIKPIASTKWYEEEEIMQFKGDNRFKQAFAYDKNHPDVLSVAAFDGVNIMGMAGASTDSNTMWQIGIDVIPEYRGRGIGTYLVKLLKNEILKRGKVPFYGTASSHFHSQNIALNAGFYPAWAELVSTSRT